MKSRTIILLSAKRTGSTAIFRMFQRHPEVGVCHANQDIDNWEPNFWNLAADALEGKPERFVERFSLSHPFLELPTVFTEDSIFALWDKILEAQGPVVFDKSPQYLGNPDALCLISKYMERGNDVRLLGLIRDPRDAITSQYELWRGSIKNDSPQLRERFWLEKYHRLEKLQEQIRYFPVIRYCDFSVAPECYAPAILNYCGCSIIKDCYQHIRPTSIGRYSASLLPEIRRWKFSKEFKSHLRKYGYPIPQMPMPQRIGKKIKMLKNNLAREFYRMRTND